MLIDRCILLCEDLFSFRTYRTVYCEGKIDHIVILVTVCLCCMLEEYIHTCCLQHKVTKYVHGLCSALTAVELVEPS